MRDEHQRKRDEQGEWRPSIRPARIEPGPREKAMAVIRLHVQADGKTYWVMIERPWNHKPLTFPGGDIKPGETRIEAAVRETFEETRLGLYKEAPSAVYIGAVRLREMRSDWEDIHLYRFDKTVPDVKALRPSVEGQIVLLTSGELDLKIKEGKLSRNAEEAINVLLTYARAT